ncbi:unnamed protein product [Mytilus coruscus]|uniref:Uncharacterized protein n=1 Tax=Mytilus coruscus TaxID=42192 RepID=A0A6J8CTY6_MYTCO|nr:unnamed protein product [Mytilus coruscus]
MELHTIQFRPIGGSSYFRIPETLEKSHAIINIKTMTRNAFCGPFLLIFTQKSKNANRISQYIRYEKELNMSGIAYPVQVKQIPKFENQNDISINVLGYENNEFFPVYISQHKRDVEQKRAKGIVKSVVRGELKHSNYIKCIIKQKNVRRQQNLIQSRKHKLQMVSVNKVALSAFDDKRYVMDNGVTPLAFGHFKIKDLVDK